MNQVPGDSCVSMRSDDNRKVSRKGIYLVAVNAQTTDMSGYGDLKVNWR